MTISWRRKSFIVVGAIVGMALGFLYHATTKTVFESTGQLLVIKKIKPLDDQNGNRGEPLETDISTSIAAMHSPAVIDRAIKKANLSELKTFEGLDLHAVIRANLFVSGAQKSSSSVPNNIIVASYRGPIPEDCKKILEGVSGAFQEVFDEGNKRVTMLATPQIGVKTSPVLSQNLTSGLLLGLLLGVGLACFAQRPPSVRV
jgi:uncharacterized protein involved in exopolysaccharide biosynthesis